MPLTPGTTLGPYSVTAKIGEGGMGEVYQARDTKLDRDVALKVLPEAFTSDPDRLARFEREAKVLASLNHPNIGSIYGLEEAEGVRALVLELVEGPTLADRISQGPIPVDEALPIAKQIAEALEAAHEQGVIHRDLKPANVKVKADGTVKVLDFGLAKAFQPDASDPSTSMSPTTSLTAAATQMGMVIGTAAYMAPEQAKGKVVDKRADVWAFGAVLYEMLTGQKPFVGDDVSDTLAAVLRADVDLNALPDGTPETLRRVISACLQRDVKQRVHDVADVRLAMEGAFETTGSAPSEPVAAQRLHVWQRPMPAAFVVVASVLFTGLIVWSATRPAPARLVRLALSPDEAGPLTPTSTGPAVAISPDGEYLAYLTGGAEGIGADELRLRSLDSPTSTTLAADGPLVNPFFSPDGQSVGFWDRVPQSLKRVSVQGGPVSTISELPAGIRGASWGADDTIVFGLNGGGLWRVAAGGGEPEALTTPAVAQGEGPHEWPEVLPGRDAVLFTATASPIAESQIAVLSLDTLEQKVVIHDGSYPRYSPTGHLLFSRAGDVWAVAFDLSRLETIGDPVPVQEGVTTKMSRAAEFAVSDTGTLVFIPGGDSVAQRRLVWVSRDGTEEPTAAPAGAYDYVALSPDGTRAAVEIDSGGGVDVWVAELDRGTLQRITTDPGDDTNPLWSPDGRRVLFRSARHGQPELLWKSADGTGNVEVLGSFDAGVGEVRPSSWTPDGTTLLVAVLNPGMGPDIGIVTPDATTNWEPLIQTPSLEYAAMVSPNGRWVAYNSDETGQLELYVDSFPELTNRQPVSIGGGGLSTWSDDGTELLYLSDQKRAIMRVSVEEGRGTPASLLVGTPEPLLDFPYVGSAAVRRVYDVTPDGERLLMIADADGESEPLRIELVLNWDQELLELVPVP